MFMYFGVIALMGGKLQFGFRMLHSAKIKQLDVTVLCPYFIGNIYESMLLKKTV